MASIIPYPGGKWRAHVRRAGHPIRTKVCATKQAAQRWARDIEFQMDTGTLETRTKATVADVFAAYNEQFPRMGRTKRYTLEALEKEFGRYRVTDLTLRLLTTFAHRRARDGAGPATVTMDLGFLGTVMRFGGPACRVNTRPVLDALELARHALRHGGVMGLAERRTRRPTEQELLALVDHWGRQARATIPIADIMLFAIATTMRLGEICRIAWKDLDEEARTIWIRDRKHPREKEGNDQLVPLLAHARVAGVLIDPVRIMNRMPSALLKIGRVFPYKEPSVSTAFMRGVAACGIHDLTFHDLRHDGISRLFQARYDVPRVALISGHRDWKHLERYTQIAAETFHDES